jgi:phage-related minor tail protein
MAGKSELGEAFVPIRADFNKFDKDMASGKNRLAGALELLGKGAAAAPLAAVVGLGAAAAATGKQVFDMSVDFQQATNAIISGTGASGEALVDLEKVAKDLKSSVGGFDQDFETLGGVVAETNTRLGLTGDGLETFSDDLLKLTRLAGGEAVENVRLVTRVMGDWGVQAEDSGQLMDQLFGASQAFGIQVDTLAQKVVQFGAPLRQMGFSLEESIALFGKWEKEGVNSELVLGSLRIAAGHFAKDNIDLRDGLTDTIDKIKNATNESEGLAIAMEVFGARAGPDMAAAIREGRFELDEAIAALEGTSGGLDDAANRAQTLGDAWQQIKNKGLLALTPITDTILDMTNEALPGMQEAMERAQPVLEDFAEEMSTKLGPAAAEIGDAIRRIAVALGVVDENADSVQAGIELLRITLDLIVGSVDLVVTWFDNLAWGIERLTQPIRDLQTGWESLKKTFADTDMSLPEWLIPGSPTPLEMGIRGLKSAVDQLPDFSSKFGGMDMPAMAGVGAGGPVSNMTNVYIDGVSASSSTGDSADEAIRLTVELLRRQLKR